MIIPGLKDWFEGTFGASLQHKTPATVSTSLASLVNSKEERSVMVQNLNGSFLFQPILNSSAVQPPTLNDTFIEELKSTAIPFSHDAEDRVFRAHGKAFLHPQTKHLHES